MFLKYFSLKSKDSVLPTITEITTPSENVKDIFTYYIKDSLRVIIAFIALRNGNRKGVNYQQGELVIETRDTTVKFELDNIGNLIVKGTDAEKYNIDNHGNLTFTE